MLPNAEINQVIRLSDNALYCILLTHCTDDALINVFLTLRNNSVNNALRSMVLKWSREKKTTFK